MSAGKYNITIEQGANWSLMVVWKDALGNPIDMTGYVVRMQLREFFEDKRAYLSLDSTPQGGITLTPLLGQMNLKASAYQTSRISIEKGVYDIEAMAPSGFVTRILMGKATISREVTR